MRKKDSQRYNLVSFLHWCSYIDIESIFGIEWISAINEKISKDWYASEWWLLRCLFREDFCFYAYFEYKPWYLWKNKEVAEFHHIHFFSFICDIPTNISLKLRINIYLKQRILQLSTMRSDLSVHIQPSEVLELLVCWEESSFIPKLISKTCTFCWNPLFNIICFKTQSAWSYFQNYTVLW